MNLNAEFAARAGLGKKLGMVEALARIGRVPDGTAHRGIDDARNIAKLLPYALGRVPVDVDARRGGRATAGSPRPFLLPNVVPAARITDVTPPRDADVVDPGCEDAHAADSPLAR